MSRIRGPLYDGPTLVQYLLGRLPAKQAEALDALSIVDDDVAARLRAVEDDLVDEYVRGRLSGATLDRFESFYLASPWRRDKVKLAQALLRTIDRTNARE